MTNADYAALAALVESSLSTAVATPYARRIDRSPVDRAGDFIRYASRCELSAKLGIAGSYPGAAASLRRTARAARTAARRLMHHA